MANTVSANLETKLTVGETIDLSESNVSGNPEVTHVISGAAVTLNASSTPAATKVSSGTLTLSSGSATIDLTAAPNPIATVDFTGLKINAFKFAADSNNTEPITIEGHATNGYDLFASLSDGKIQLDPGDVCLMLCNNSNPDVGASLKVIDFASSDVDAVLEYELVGG